MNRHGLTLGVLFCSISVCAEVGIKSDVVYGHKAGMALTYDVLTPENPNGAGVLSMISGAWYLNLACASTAGLINAAAS